MQKQTFIDNMTERGYELKYSRNGNITPTMTAITREGTTDDETLRMIDWFTV